MRIIAGEYRSRIIKTLEGDKTRPTQDRIKEAMFSSLGNVYIEDNVLDLFGGSGSIALESISRGASFAYICDMNQHAIQVIKDNVNHLQVEKQVHIYQGNYLQALEKWKEETFSFIFIDPPYALHVIEECLQYIEKHNMLKEHGVIVVESDLHHPLQERYNSLIQYKQKKYGVTLLRYYQKETNHE